MPRMASWKKHSSRLTAMPAVAYVTPYFATRRWSCALYFASCSFGVLAGSNGCTFMTSVTVPASVTTCASEHAGPAPGTFTLSGHGPFDPLSGTESKPHTRFPPKVAKLTFHSLKPFRPFTDNGSRRTSIGTSRRRRSRSPCQ